MLLLLFCSSCCSCYSFYLIQRSVDEGKFLQEELNKKRAELKVKEAKIKELNSNLQTSQDELSKWFRQSLKQEDLLSQQQTDYSTLERRFSQIASRKLMVLSDQGRVFELSSGHAPESPTPTSSVHGKPNPLTRSVSSSTQPRLTVSRRGTAASHRKSTGSLPL
eukprot:m.298785 g.298785  ORF g.298785 m.298785 type:complete len:164 (+) comp15865_c0_seq2:1002-1493(+)